MKTLRPSLPTWSENALMASHCHMSSVIHNRTTTWRDICMHGSLIIFLLIPRPETEFWALKLADVIIKSSPQAAPTSVLDICTGTGCIPLLLAAVLPEGSFTAVGVDSSTSAVALAGENVRHVQGPNNDLSPRRRNPVTMLLGNLWDDSFFTKHIYDRGPFDVVTCNPPYIPRQEYDKLPPSVRDHEDVLALLGDKNGERDGLSFYRRLVEVLRPEKGVLKEGGMLVVEHGDGQSGAVQRVFIEGFAGRLRHIEAWKDQWNKDRVIMARV